MHVIFVDSKSTNPETIADVLRQKGCNVSVAAIGADEKSLLEKFQSYSIAQHEATVVVVQDEACGTPRNSDQSELTEEFTRRQVDLEQRERHLQAVIDAEPECVKLLDRDGNLLEMNPAGVAMIEADSFSQVDHHCVYPLVNAEFRESFRHMTEEVFEGKPAILEFKITGLKGTERWLETHASPFRSETGDIVALLGITRDITLRKQATNALFNSSLRLKLATDAANIGLWDWDLELNQVYYSKEWKRQIGYDDHEISHDFSEWQDRVHPDDLEFLEKKIESYLANPTNSYEVEFRFRHRNGSYLWIFAQADVIRDSTGKVVRMLGCHVDITRRKEYETRLIASEERLRLALDSAQMATFTWNQTRGELDHSIRFRKLWGFQDVSQTTCWSDCFERIHAEDVAKVTNCVDRAQDHPNFVSEFRITTDDQTTKWLLIAGKVEQGPNQEQVVRGVVKDISDRKHTQLKLQEREYLLSQTQRIAGIGSWVWDIPKETISWTDEMYRVYDVDPNAYQPSPEHNRNLPHPDDRHILSNWMVSALKGENPGAIEFRHLDRKGRIRIIRGQGEITLDRDGNPLLGMGTAQDITELRRHTDELVARDRVLSSLAEGTSRLLRESQWHLGLNELLGRLGEATESSRVYLFQRQGPIDKPTVSQKAEWVAEGIEPQIDNPELQNIDIAAAGFDQWVANMAAGEPVISLVKNRPAPERALLESQGILSLAVFPITISDDWWGFIGFDDCKHERRWSDAEANALKAVTGVMSAVIERETILAQLNESEETFSKAFKSSLAPLAITTMDGEFVEINAAFCKSLGYEQDEVIGHTAVELGLLSQADRSKLIDQVSAAGGSVQNCEIRMYTKNGTCRDIIYSLTTITLNGEPHRLSTGIDITDRKKAETERSQSERRFRRIVETAHEGIWTLDPSGQTTFVNRQLAEILGWSATDVMGMPFHQFIDNGPDMHAERILERSRQGHTEQRDIRLKHAQGRDVWARISTSPMYDDQEAFMGVLAMVSDITERRLARQALEKSQEHLSALVTSVDGIVWEADVATFAFTYVSPSAERLLGYPTSEWTSDSEFWPSHIHPDDRSAAVAFCKKASREQRHFEFEYRFIAADGRSLWFRDIVTVIFENHQPARLRGLMIDITPRIKDLQRIRHLNRVYAVLSEINQVIVREIEPQVILDKACQIAVEKGDYLFAWIGLKDGGKGSLQIAAHAGASEDTLAIVRHLLQHQEKNCQFTTKALKTQHHAICRDIESDPAASDWRADALARGYRSMVSIPLTVKGTTVGIFNLYAATVDFFDSQEMELLDELADDICFALANCELENERLIAVERLAQSELRFRELAETIDEAFSVIDPHDNRILYISPAYEKIWGRSCQSLYDAPHSWYESVHPDDIEEVRSATTSVESGKSYNLEYRIKLPNGGTRWVREWAFFVFNDQGHVERKLGVARDITQQKTAEQQLARREEYFRTLIEYGSDLITVIDPDGSILYQSPSVSRILGYNQGDLIGKRVFDYIHPNDVALTHEAIKRVLSRPKKQIPAEHRFKHQNGSWRVLQSIGRSFMDQEADGFMVVNSRDVTDTRELESQFLQAQKMEAIGQLAGGVAHDFNNILAAIMMQVELMGTDDDINDEIRSGLRDLNLYAERAADLTRQLLLFSRRQVMRQQDLDFNVLVTSLSKMVQRIIGEDIRLQLHLSPSPLWLRADAGMLDQVLMNLCVNARDAMPNGGRLRIETGTHDADNPLHQIPEELGAGPCHWLRVVDNGEGIPADVLPRIFDPFFTTKEPGKGTGLGLATVFGIVNQHGGWVGVDTFEPSGTAFTIYLPALSEIQSDSEGESRESHPIGGSETILLVEDDPAVQMLTQSILKRHGYQVIAASNGQEALSLWALHQHQIELLFTDLVMPGGYSGHQLAKRILAEKPSLRVIYCSGYSAEIAGKDLELNPGENFVQKPFLPNHLLKTVRSALDS